MRHMLAGENLALMAPRRVEHAGAWQHAFVTDAISDHVAVSLKTIDYHFPLYLYPDPEPDRPEKTRRGIGRGIGRYVAMMLLEPRAAYGGKKPNLNPAVAAALAAAYGKEPTPEDIFHYVYAVLYAPSYRAKYAEFLRMDFPRIPFTADAKLFRKLAALGEKLVALHLLKSRDLDPPACRFEGEGGNRVEKDRKTGLRYDSRAERVYINAAQYFAPVPESVWTCQIGGYQVCEKWLKDRAERRLELDDIRAYCRIVTAIGRTIELQKQMDGIYPEAEKDTVPMPVADDGTGTDGPTDGSARRRPRRV
jgi:predicted helicase